MLKRIRLKNFQCHRRLDIDLQGPITVITGPSDSGKSAIVRALRWVLFNSLSGKSFITQGATECMVAVEFDDFTVIRRRTASKNIYRLVCDGVKKDFVSFGTTVPEPIAKRLRLDVSNLQSQHDAPYWLSLSGSAVAVELNALVHLDLIDNATGKLLARQQSQKLQRTSSLIKLETLQAKIAALKPIPPERVGDCFESLKRVNPARMLKLEEILAEAEKVREAVSYGGQIRDLRGSLDGVAGERLQALENKRESCRQLQELITQVQALQTTVQKAHEQRQRVMDQIAQIKVCPECLQPLAKNPIPKRSSRRSP